MKATDILHKEADQVDEFNRTERVASFRRRCELRPDVVRAVADLMDAIRDQSPACVFEDGTDGFICLLCRHASENGKPSEHNAWCPLAALERLIEGERVLTMTIFEN